MIAIPGHSKGSIGIYTDSHDLFCGDFFDNSRKPGLTFLMDYKVAASEILKKIQQLRVETVYCGHGKPFMMTEFLKLNEVSRETRKSI